MSAGTHYFQIQNKGDSQTQVSSLKLEFLDEDPEANNYNCQP